MQLPKSRQTSFSSLREIFPPRGGPPIFLTLFTPPSDSSDKTEVKDCGYSDLKAQIYLMLAIAAGYVAWDRFNSPEPTEASNPRPRAERGQAPPPRAKTTERSSPLRGPSRVPRARPSESPSKISSSLSEDIGDSYDPPRSTEEAALQRAIRNNPRFQARWTQYLQMRARAEGMHNQPPPRPKIPGWDEGADDLPGASADSVFDPLSPDPDE